MPSGPDLFGPLFCYVCMDFRTELNPEKLPVSLRLTSSIVTIGSCFAETMGRQLSDLKLDVLANPFGTIFNPVSGSKLLLAAIDDREPDSELFVERDGVWFHHDVHSSLWARSRPELERRLRDVLRQTGTALKRADWLFLTLGTAVVYRHLETGKVVANCHKLPAKQFEKYVYTYEHLLDILNPLLRKLRRFNPALQVLLTVSPVRHTKDTLPVNGVSKALLRSVCHELTTWHDGVHYFPAYEIVMDDLRDYRFYEADLIHPNEQAKEYIFEKFVQCAFDAELRTFKTEWEGVRKSLAHRPFHSATESHRQFLEALLKQLDRLSTTVNVGPERAEVLQRLFDLTTVERPEPPFSDNQQRLSA